MEAQVNWVLLVMLMAQPDAAKLAMQQGKFDEALQYYFMALQVYTNVGNQVKVGGTLKNIGNTYRVLQRYNNASSFLLQALAVQQKEKDSNPRDNQRSDMGR
jgi:tetratricopeptide (TPR) repeat protein